MIMCRQPPCHLRTKGTRSSGRAILAGLFDTTGFRVPNLVISPFTKPGYVSHTNADFTAILKLIETRFLTPDPTTGLLPSLTARDAAQPDLTEFFDWTSPNLASTNPPEQTGLPCYYSLP